MRLSRGGGARAVLAVLAVWILGGCDQLAMPGWQASPERQVSQLDGATQSTPLIVGTIVDAAGQPVALARVRVFEGFRIGLDGVTQSTPLEGVTQTTPLNSTGSAGLDGVTQTTPLDGVTQTTPLDGVTQTTPLDGVTQTTPLQAIVESRSDGTFAVRVPDRAVLSLEASRVNGDRAAILNMPIDRKAARLDVGKLTVAQPGSLTGKVVGPPGLDLAGTSVFVPGTDLVAKADVEGRYTIPGVPARTVAVAAIRARYRPALARFVSVLPGKATTAPDLVLVPAKPRLHAIEPDNAGPGATVELHGADFGAAAFTPVEVRFGSLKSLELERTRDNTILATVPAGARSGPVDIVADGVPSNSVPFTVIASLSLAPEATRTLAGTAVPVQVRAFDSDGRAVPDPALAFHVDPPDLGTLDAGAVFHPSRPGFGRLLASTGAIRAGADLGFGEWAWSTVLSPADPDDPATGELEGAAGAVRLWQPTLIRVLTDSSLAFMDESTRPAEPLSMPGHKVYPRTRVRRLADGKVSVLVGSDNPGYDGDGRPLLASRIAGAGGLSVGPDGVLLLTDFFNFRIRVAVTSQDQRMAGRSLLAGALWDLAGTGEVGPEGSGLPGPDGPAATVDLGELGAIAWNPAGAAVFVEVAPGPGAARMTRIREVGSTGLVRTLVEPAGPGPAGADPTEPVQDPRDFRARVLSLAVDSHGNVYMGTLSRIWMLCRRSGDYFGVRAEVGQIVLLAGTGEINEFNGEEGPAGGINLREVSDLAIFGSSLLLVEKTHYRVRLLDPSGRLLTIAGGGRGPSGTARDSASSAVDVNISARHVAGQRNGLGIQALLGEPRSLAVSPDGAVFVTDSMTHRILRLVR